jgi:DNA-binding response OmpR family regulator
MSDAAERTKILIVDDEEDVVKPIAFRLDLHGFNVFLEPNGEFGYETAVAHHPDLILLDIMMPGIDGLSLCRLLKEREDTSDIPIIMLTAKTTMGDVEESFRAKADDYIAKPFEWDELLGKINRLLHLNATGAADAASEPIAQRSG